MSDINLTLAEHKAVSPMVFAFKIASTVRLEDGKTVLAPKDGGFLALIVDEKFTELFHPQVGDYFVVSTSQKNTQTILPAEIFEDPAFGFTPVQKGTQS